MPTAIEFNNISKLYRLGLVSSGTLSNDLKRWWQMSILGKEDPFLKVGSVNDRSKAADGEYVWALKDIDFKVEQGDVVGIIGKNGAGKSTLLKLLSKVTGPTTGTIKAKGRIASLLEVGTGFHSELTGRENIYMNGTILGMTKKEIDSKIDEIVDFSGCERYIDTPVKRYSSGMTVRLGFAVAAHLDPEILVVDEVLAVGDAEFQKKAIGKMQDVSKGEGRTVLFVSHNMASIRNLCHHGVVLEKGMVEFSGDVNDAIDLYMASSSVSYSLDEPISALKRPEGCSGKIVFKSVDFLNRDNKPIIPQSGQFVRIQMAVDVAEECTKACVALDILTQWNSVLMNMPSFVTEGDLCLSKGSHLLNCDIERLPLTGGVYKLSLWASEDDVKADFLEAAVRMEVIDDDYFHTGRTMKGSHLRGKIVLGDYRWTCL
jgi:lipopolysaccharide transport system ATP-binding protein